MTGMSSRCSTTYLRWASRASSVFWISRKLVRAGTQAQVNYTYANDDQVNTISNSTLTATFAYDGDGRRSSLKTTGVAANAVQTFYAYDNDSRPCALYYGSG